MRKAITTLQSASTLYGSSLTPAQVVEMSGVFPDADVAAAVAAIKGGFDACKRSVGAIVASGYGLDSVLEKVLDALIADASIAPDAKATIAERFAAVDKRLVDGADEELQLMDLFASSFRAIAGVKIEADRMRTLII